MADVFYDPQREFSLRVEEMAALKFKREVMKMVTLNMAVSGVFVAVAVVAAGFSDLLSPEFGVREVLEIIKMYFLINIGVFLCIVGGKFFQFSDVMSWQMRGGGSNFIGTMLKILDKLFHSESRLQDLNAAWADTTRVLWTIAQEGMGAGLDWAEIEYQFLCEIQKMTELKGCTSVVLPEAKKIAGQILLWIEGTYLPTWEKDLAQGNIEDAVSSVVALEKAKLVVPEFIIFVDEMEFLTKDAIDGKLWKT